MNESTFKKSPLSVLNELIRKQKIQFSLTNEIGESHKTYFMQLKLDNGEIYISSGPSIKKSQHAVAQLALVKSSYLNNSIKADFSNEIELNKKSYVMIHPDNLKYKSDTTILYELASKLKKILYFKLLTIESDDNNNISVECLFEEFSSIGYGKSKFEAKSFACTNMLNILKDNLVDFDETLNEIKNYKRQKINQKSISFNDDKKKLTYGENLNPISRLMQLCNNNGTKQLSFFITNGNGHYMSKCEFKEHMTFAMATNQKLAKHKSAQMMLEKLGYRAF